MKNIRSSSRLLLLSSFLLLLSFSLCAFGAANDTLISFSTPGPDTYLDGTAVLDGECYALVWTKSGAAFEGLAADGAAVGSDSEVLVFAPVAKAGRCPTVVFELDAALAPKYAGGGFGVYLLDTRLASGKVGGLNAKGLPVAVNGYGEVATAGSSVGATFLSPQAASGESAGGDKNVAPTGGGVSVTTKSAVPANAPQPQITSIRVVGANVVLTVRNTLPCLKYVANEVDLSSTSTTTSTTTTTTTPTQGAATTDEEITVIVPKKGDSGFFKVGRE